MKDERLPVPAELGRVDAQEDPGSAGERWQRHQILARWHIHVSCFLQNKNRIKTNDFTCFFIDLTFFVTSTVVGTNAQVCLYCQTILLPFD